ncbi:restriction endonuclease subunit S [Pseudoalteromonas sp. ACER1]|uniref:restriction endonuclease subunit S n=1 Tax=unclassified Pseudoalteromonas TaxID=194690 RepID=UPI001F2533C6|nr:MULTISPECIES: restriction endonuclease subunit S [unclassified Pseudoalteromonas]MCF2848348.1 restriction endonuclease subunit S [Pseudoalteromonas sp. PAST1]MCF2918270.1 restriction endonuclease subunit S [Pseudoalteromonas sp. Cn5-37]MCO7213275.1 restriction endonuclease subunit S [Pseudoalteromonas sp. ACER1]
MVYIFYKKVSAPMFTILCEVADVFAGYPFRGTIPSDENGDVHVIQVRDTRATGEVFQDEMIKVILPGKKAPNWLRSGDVLFVAKGVKHFSALVEDLPVKTVCSPHFFLIRVKPEYQNRVKPEFICWQLNQLPAQRYFRTTAEGSLHLSVRRQVLENTPLKLLDIKDQQLIANMHKCAIKERSALLQLIENKDKEQAAIALNLLN